MDRDLPPPSPFLAEDKPDHVQNILHPCHRKEGGMGPIALEPIMTVQIYSREVLVALFLDKPIPHSRTFSDFILKCDLYDGLGSFTWPSNENIPEQPPNPLLRVFFCSTALDFGRDVCTACPFGAYSIDIRLPSPLFCFFDFLPDFLWGRFLYDKYK